MENNIAISVSNVSKYYKMYGSQTDRFKEFFHLGKKTYHNKFWALRDISFDIEKGTTFGIVGLNGSGKSTLLQIISGIIRPTSGNVTVNGRVSALLELGAGFHRDFSGRENVFMQAALMGISRDEMEQNYERILEFADIGSFIDQPVRTYSSGMYVRLAFATAVNIDPDVLIVDEVLAVGDDMFRRRCFNKLEDFTDRGKTILFVSHDLETVTSICNQAMLVDKGEILDIGSPKDITNIYSRLLTDLEEEYLRRINGKSNSQNSLDELPDKRFLPSDSSSGSEYRYGAGGAEIIEIEILNNKNERSNVLEHGKEFTIRIRVLFNKKMKDPMIGYRIRTLTGIDVSGTNTITSKSPVGQVDKGFVSVLEFRQVMTLNRGSYAVTSGIAEEISKQMLFHDRRMDVLIFKVVSESPRSSGLVNMDTQVHIKTKEPENSSVDTGNE